MLLFSSIRIIDLLSFIINSISLGSLFILDANFIEYSEGLILIKFFIWPSDLETIF